MPQLTLKRFAKIMKIKHPEDDGVVFFGLEDLDFAFMLDSSQPGSLSFELTAFVYCELLRNE